MANILSLFIWGVAAYSIADKVNKDEKTEFKCNPILYCILSALFGFMFSMGLLYGNKFKFEGNKRASMLCYGLVIFAIVLNIVTIL